MLSESLTWLISTLAVVRILHENDFEIYSALSRRDCHSVGAAAIFWSFQWAKGEKKEPVRDLSYRNDRVHDNDYGITDHLLSCIAPCFALLSRPFVFGQGSWLSRVSFLAPEGPRDRFQFREIFDRSWRSLLRL